MSNKIIRLEEGRGKESEGAGERKGEAMEGTMLMRETGPFLVKILILGYLMISDVSSGLGYLIIE